MKREMLKSYESPLTVRTQVALESGICAASADPESPYREIGAIEAQKVNTDFDSGFENPNQWD